jgi:hypothetical protein
MNSGTHSTISAAIFCVHAFFALGKAFLSDEDETVISHTGSNDSQISILIPSGEMSNPRIMPQMCSDSKNHKPNVVLFKLKQIVK